MLSTFDIFDKCLLSIFEYRDENSHRTCQRSESVRDGIFSFSTPLVTEKKIKQSRHFPKIQFRENS
jgi:hypothetical protein